MAPEPPHAHVRRVEEIPRVLAAAAVLAVTSWIATRDIPGAEQLVFEFVNRQPGWLEWVLWAPMQLGSLFGPVVVAALAWWRWRRWRPAVGAVVAGVVAWQLAKVVKDRIGRGRPLDELTDVVRRAGTPTDGLGFVSGHSAVAFALATVVSPYLSRRGRAGAYLLAAVVGLARIHVGAHLPLDVVGGAALGCLVGYLWRLAVGVPADEPDEPDGVDPPMAATPPGE
ncbi:MAG: phosphatase PAP2 family protein [Microthrixaceae bacterium]